MFGHEIIVLFAFILRMYLGPGLDRNYHRLAEQWLSKIHPARMSSLIEQIQTSLGP